MIVRPSGPDLLLITQPDHAALSAEILAAWRADGLPERATRETVLLATREHDNGWLEPDNEPMVNPSSGEPYDFITAPDEVKRAVWLRALRRLAPTRPGVAALIAQHVLTVYRRHREEARWSTFLARIGRIRDACRMRAGAPEAAEESASLTASASRGGGYLPSSGLRPAARAFLLDYRALFFGDLLSLVFCNGWTEPFEGGGYRIRVHQSLLSITPDPFGGAHVPLRVRARRVPDRHYGSDEDLRRTLAGAPEGWLTGTAGSFRL